MPSLTHIALGNAIKKKAADLGFSACGIAKAAPLEAEAIRLKHWLKKGRHGSMQYMANHQDKRPDPTQLLEGARSVIVLLYSYSPKSQLPEKDNYKIARYAYGLDYHDVMKTRMRELMAFLDKQVPGHHGRLFVDSAPVLERSWAEKAGLGWIGKNTCLITPKQGSYFFIGEIITTALLQEDTDMVPNHCGGCTRCIHACPTGALDAEGLDSRKCISYLTIEYRGEKLPEAFKDKMENWIFGCDICQEVCPWNRLAEPHHEPRFTPSQRLALMRKADWKKLDEQTYRDLFRGSAVKRAKFTGLKRNIEFLGDH